VLSRRAVTRTSLQVGANVIVYALALACLFPFLWALSTALKPENDALSSQFFLGFQYQWDNFATAWNFFPFGRFMVNSAVMALGGVLVVLVASTTGGYVFASLRFPGRERVFLVYVATMLIPPSVTVIPLFIVCRFLGLYDSYLGLIIPISFGAFGTFLMRQFFRGLPGELRDAARIDGAGELRIFWSIMLPLVRPAAAVLGVFTFISDWGNFIWPLVVTQSPDLSTLTVGLRSFQGQYGTFWSYMMAGSLVAILPTIVIVILLQRYLVRGLAFTAFGGR
jgi:multiple sugar transport system permease protein